MPDTFQNRSAYQYASNKEIIVKKIEKIHIDKFRTLIDRDVILGNNITIVVGRNGTMKTTIMGLMAHPFSSEADDFFGGKLKTPLSKVFKMSTKYDDNYSYDIHLITNKNENLKEKVTIDERGGRHRIVVSGHEKGDGNFNYNTNFMNLGRLYPIIESNAKEQDKITLSEGEHRELIRFYESVLSCMDYNKFVPVSDDDNKNKQTYGPSGDEATYDFNSISSGEDNLGAIFSKLLSFERQKDKLAQGEGGGILCIDEIEASLHPSAQVKIVEYLLKWSKKNNVQVVFTTHSLHIVQHIYLNMKNSLDNSNVIINFISYSEAGSNKNYKIIANPDYSLAYRELTLENSEEVAQKYQVKVYCEDDLAVHFIRCLITRRHIRKVLDFQTNLDCDLVNNGCSKTLLISLCKNFPSLMYQNNAFIVLDGDVKDEEVSSVRDKLLFTRLPDANFFAIERRIIHYIIGLDDNDQFFKKFKKLKPSFLADFTQLRITPLSLENIETIGISTCKDWAKQNVGEFKKYIRYYCDHLPEDVVTKFREDFMNCLNYANERLGLPTMSY